MAWLPSGAMCAYHFEENSQVEWWNKTSKDKSQIPNKSQIQITE
jgi:hypothetical protein